MFLVDLPATVESMARVNLRGKRSGDVVEGVGVCAPIGMSRASRLRVLCAATLALLLMVIAVVTPPSYADDAGSSPQPSSPQPSAPASTTSGITTTGNITDTENLLGDRVSAVSDAITATRQTTGVTVKLLYLSTFGGQEKPEVWAGDVLESTKPAPNTVMLAVASKDGNLVVVVSSNSDEWLKSKKTADALSDAALRPIEKDTPDWSGSAIAMMNQIDTIKQTSTSSDATRLGVIILISVLVAIALITIVVLILRRRGVRLSGRRRSGKHASHKLPA